jgi:hypothetical protein
LRDVTEIGQPLAEDRRYREQRQGQQSV